MRKIKCILILLIFPLILKSQIKYLGIIGDTCSNAINVNYTYTNYSIGSHGAGYYIYKNGTLIRNQFGDNETGQGYVITKLKVLSDLIVFVAINSKGILYVDGTIDGGTTWKNYGGSNGNVVDILPVNKNYAYILIQSFGGSNNISISRASDISPKYLASFNIDSAKTNEIKIKDTLTGEPFCSQMSNIGFRFQRDNMTIDYVIYSQTVPLLISALNNSNNIMIYPIPTNDILYFELVLPTKVIITDYVGRIIYSRNYQSGKSSINLTSFYPGIYYLIAQNDERKVSKLIIKK